VSAITDDIFETSSAPFVSGALVLVTLSAPREKFWGRFFASRRGISLRDVELVSFEDFVAMTRSARLYARGFLLSDAPRRTDGDGCLGQRLPSLAERVPCEPERTWRIAERNAGPGA